MKCIFCGTENDNDEINCKECGSKIRSNEVEEKLNAKAPEKEEPIDTTEIENVQKKDEAIDPTEIIDAVDDTKNVKEEKEDKTKAIFNSIDEKAVTAKTKAKETLKDISGVEEFKKAMPKIHKKGSKDSSETAENVSSEKLNENDKTTENTTEKGKTKTKKAKVKPVRTGMNKELAIKICVGIAVIVGLLFGVEYFINRDNSNPEIVFESLGVLYDSNAKTAKTNVLTDKVNEEDVPFVKTSNDNSVFYYPKEMQSTNNGILEYKLYKNTNGVEELVLDKVSEDYFVSEDGQKVLYPTNVDNLYGENVADLYFYNYTTRTSINSNVIISSVTISDDSKSVMYLKGDKNDLNVYTFKNGKNKELDTDIDEVLYISDDLNDVFYTKTTKNIDNNNLCDLYKIENRSKVITVGTNILEDTISVNDNDIVYLKYPEEHPDFAIYSNGIQNVSNKDMKEYKKEFDKFCSNNFFSLCEVDYSGKNENEISNDVYKVHYVSDNGKAVLYSKLKQVSDISKENVSEIEDLVTPKNLDTFLLDGNKNTLELQRVDESILLKDEEQEGYFDYDDKNNILYYIDGTTATKLDSKTENLTYQILDENASYVNYDDDKNVIILSKNGDLFKIDSSNNKTLIDENVLQNNIYVDDRFVFYQKKGQNNLNELYEISGKKGKLISEGLSENDIYVLRNKMYYKDAIEGFMVFDGKKSTLIDKSATQIKVLE